MFEFASLLSERAVLHDLFNIRNVKVCGLYVNVSDEHASEVFVHIDIQILRVQDLVFLACSLFYLLYEISHVFDVFRLYLWLVGMLRSLAVHGNR